MIDFIKRHKAEWTNPKELVFEVGGNSEMADAHRSQLPDITFFGLTPDGRAPYWHQMGDTPDKMKPDVLEHTYHFTKLFIEQVDKRI